MINLTEQIDFSLAKNLFHQAQQNGLQLLPGNFETNIWLHKENINHDFVIKIAKYYTDSRIFIISKGLHKGFYVYSNRNESCIKIITTSNKLAHAEVV